MTVWLYTAAQSRQIDDSIMRGGLSGMVLMKRAARAALAVLREQWPAATRITVLCGGGNNGGDGYLLAALAAEAGLLPRVIAVVPPAALRGDAAVAAEYAAGASVPIDTRFDDAPAMDLACDVLVDALLGTGASGAPREAFARTIEAINRAGVPVLSLDVPSGLSADTGWAEGAVVKADVTVMFITHKQGLYTAQAPDVCGQLIHAPLVDQLPAMDDVHATALLSLPSLLSLHLPPRQPTAHKGHGGHVMLVGGDAGMGGAIVLAAEAAARVGAGLTSAVTQPQHVAALLVRRPEVMAHGVTSGQALAPLLDKPTVLVVGPGLGQSAWSEQMLQQSTLSGLPLVLDADGLNLLAMGRVVRQRHRPDWVLTPHPGEAARLLKTNTETVQCDRFAAVRAVQAQYGGTVILKGPGTLVCDVEGRVTLCAGANPAMASGGMGDVLAGLVGGLLAQGLVPSAAAQLAVCLHASMGLQAAGSSTRGVLAADLLAQLPAALDGR